MQSSKGPGDRQLAVFVSLGVGAVVAGVTIVTFWLIYGLAFAPYFAEARDAANAPYNATDGIQAITEAEPNDVEGDVYNREPWLGSDSWTVAMQLGQEYIDQYPEPQNVQVLKGMTTAQVWNYMQYEVSGAMGVSCQYCHDINNYAADAYPTKISARLMLLLLRDVNSQYISNLPNWRGNYVRCATCHNGQAVGMATYSDQAANNVPPITVTLEALDETGAPIREDAPQLSLIEASLYYYYNYLVWNPYTGEDGSGRGSLSLTHDNGRTQDQVTINQNVMNMMNWSMGVGCTYCHNSRNFYAYEAANDLPQFQDNYAVNRLKAQRMLLMTTFMAENWNRYVLPSPEQPANVPIENQQYFVNIDDTNYAVPGCYTCHQGNIVPKASINVADLDEMQPDVSYYTFPPVLTGTGEITDYSIDEGIAVEEEYQRGLTE